MSWNWLDQNFFKEEDWLFRVGDRTQVKENNTEITFSHPTCVWCYTEKHVNHKVSEGEKGQTRGNMNVSHIIIVDGKWPWLRHGLWCVYVYNQGGGLRGPRVKYILWNFLNPDYLSGETGVTPSSFRPWRLLLRHKIIIKRKTQNSKVIDTDKTRRILPSLCFWRINVSDSQKHGNDSIKVREDDCRFGRERERNLMSIFRTTQDR